MPPKRKVKSKSKAKPKAMKVMKASTTAMKAMKAMKVSSKPVDRARIYAVVPARAGSKGVKGKNIKDFLGKPLMGWAIQNAIQSKYISRVFVSTDSPEYQTIAIEQGAEVPFLRPAAIAHDTATDYQLFDHFLKWFKQNEPKDKQPALLVQLRATAPCVTVEEVDACIEHFLKHELEGYDSLRTVTPIDHEAFNQYLLDPRKPERLLPLVKSSWRNDDYTVKIPEPQSVARQILPKIYWHNAYVDIMRPETILEQKCCMGNKCLAFHMPPDANADIDTPEQWAAAEEKKRAMLAASPPAPS